MINPDFNLLLWLILIFYLLNGIVMIVLGSIGAKRSQEYDVGTVLSGIVMILIFVAVLIF